MDCSLNAFFKLLDGFEKPLIEKKLSETYRFKYIKLYRYLNGTKQRVRYEVLADLWNVHIDTARSIINIFIKHNVLNKNQQTDQEENNNRGYLFVIPLVHPEINE